MKCIRNSLFLIFLCKCALAAPPFYFSLITNSLPGTTSPWTATTADFNADGKLDAAVGYYSPAGFVQILLGRNDGTFDPGTNLTAGARPVSLAVGEFNGDERPDLVSANEGEGTISIFLGNGDGTFTARSNITVGLRNEQVRVKDLDQNGTDDLVITRSQGVMLLYGLGNGDFGQPVEYSTDAGTSWVTVTDLNNDARQDLVTANKGVSRGSVGVLLGNTNGTFLTASNYLV